MKRIIFGTLIIALLSACS
ncbi:lipoprotein, partial [Vibrio parahaemolyticus]